MRLPRLRRRSFFPWPLEVLGVWIARMRYRVRAQDRERVPALGGALLIANHLSYVDPVLLQLACPRRIRFVAYLGLKENPLLDLCLRGSGTLLISAHSPTESIRAAVRAVQAGELVCLFPEGHISRTGQLMEIKRGFEVIARRAQVPVIPAAIDGVWGSNFSFSGGRYFWKWPRGRRREICVVFGAPIPPAEVTGHRARLALLDLGVAAFQQRRILRSHLGREAVRSLVRHPHRIAVIDRTAERRVLRSAALFAAAVVLAKRIRATVPERRVGIALPPGAGACIANIAVVLAGKIPVNLNYTLGPRSFGWTLQLGEMATVLSARALRQKFPELPWPERTLDLREEIGLAGGKRAMLPWLAAAYVCPARWLARRLRLPTTGDRDEAALLFTSGSADEPKGVPLTHRNLFGNCEQIVSTAIMPRECSMMGCLPLFHSLGFTVTLWYALLHGARIVTVPSPLDTRRIIDAIREENVTVLLGAPSFLRPIAKKAEPAELRSLLLAVSGAEKMPPDLHRIFLERFHLRLRQGYGLTETSPVTNVNQPDPPVTTATAEPQVGDKPPSTGRMLPGLTARILDADTGRELATGETGIVAFQGVNIFPGYLRDRTKTAAVLRDGWLITGDLGRFDEDGFLYIEGRLSRFAKIGGEMVSHLAVEQALAEAYGWDQSERPYVAVVSVPDPTKGEALVLITTEKLDGEDLRRRLHRAGLPNLWMPKVVRQVTAIPMLGSGKLDVKACRALALKTT